VFFVLTPFVTRLNRDWRPDALTSRAAGRPVLADAAFAVAWTLCVAPTLGSSLTPPRRRTRSGGRGPAGLLTEAQRALDALGLDFVYDF
jgi:cytochrome c-type biogenesis protein